MHGGPSTPVMGRPFAARFQTRALQLIRHSRHNQSAQPIVDLGTLGQIAGSSEAAMSQMGQNR